MATVTQRSSESWLSVNPILGLNEIGYDSGTGGYKVGNGTSRWNQLEAVAYTLNDAVSLSLPTGIQGTIGTLSTVAELAADTAFTTTYQPKASFRANINSVNLPKWVKAVAGVRAGQGDAKILCIGDSTVNGGSTVGQSASWPSLLAAQMNSFMIPTSNGMGIPASTLTAVTDARWTLGAAWAKIPAAGKTGWGTNAVYRGTSSSANLVYADARVNADRFDVYYVRVPSGTRGTATLTATGGSGTVIDTNGAAGIVKVTLSAGSAATSNTLTVLGSGTGIVEIIGVEPWLSTASKVRVANAGVNSSTTTQWVDASGAFAIGAIPAIQAYAPNLTIIQMGINDAYASLASATWVANMNIMITAAKVSGDVIIMSTVPSSDATAAGFEVAYANASQALTTNGFIDIYRRAGNYSTWNTAGYMFDDRHPSVYGHADEAQFVFSCIRDI